MRKATATRASTTGTTRNVITVEAPDPCAHWRELIALLILPQAALHGLRAMYFTGWMIDDGIFVRHLLLAALSYGCVCIGLIGAAYSIWRSSPGLKGWLLLALVSWFAIILCDLSSRGSRFPSAAEWFRLRIMPDHTALAWLTDLVLNGNDFGLLQWLTFLVVAWRIVHKDRFSERSSDLWPRIAAAWSFIFVLEACLNTQWVPPMRWHGLHVLYLMMPALLGMLLLRSSRGAIAVAVVVFLLAIGASVMPILPTLQSPWDNMDGRPPFWLFLVAISCAPIIAISAPWVIIAAFAWRFRKPAFPDDGSPYPRRYCGHCHYNLTGNVTGICPECGKRI